MERVGSKMQTATQGYDKRPYGVGLLLAGFDVSNDKTLYIYQLSLKIYSKEMNLISGAHVYIKISLLF